MIELTTPVGETALPESAEVTSRWSQADSRCASVRWALAKPILTGPDVSGAPRREYSAAMSTESAFSETPRGSGRFPSTQWSIVLAAGDPQAAGGAEALALLCQAYWYPLYAYIRRRVSDVHQAQDLTQAFFSHVLEKHTIGRANPQRGRFRAFLLSTLQNFLANQRTKAAAQKRRPDQPELSLDFQDAESRYQIEPSHQITPEALYQRRWVLTLLEHVLKQLQDELAREGKQAHFEQLQAGLTGEMTAEDYHQAAATLRLTPAATKQAAYRLRKRYRQLLRQEVARTVSQDDQVDDEIGELFASLVS